jgi:peptidoglycan-associated lipoprotein|tara:strand:+ start:34 stop:579 length:546 start_codon:yes stop_codon:yes gene_type:complete
VIKGFVNNFVILSVILLISGCGIIPKKDPDVIITTEPMLTKSEEGEVDMITSAESINLDSVGDKGYTLGNNVIYFDYDKYSVEKKEDKAVIKKYSNYMRKYKNSKVRIEGHADERGSRAYNLALGEKRAENIKEILLINGVSKDSIEVVSYGEENQAVLGTNEDTHSLNRRVEIVFSDTGK